MAVCIVYGNVRIVSREVCEVSRIVRIFIYKLRWAVDMIGGRQRRHTTLK
jgi:hypothetical protein